MDQTNQSTPAPAPVAATVPTPVAVSAAAPTPVQPAPSVATPVTVQNPSSKGHMKMILIILAIILILGLGVGGYYYMTTMNASQSEVISAPSGMTLGEEFKVLEDEVNNTPIDDVDSQFIEVDKDLQQL